MDFSAIQRWQKRNECFAKQQPGLARQKLITTIYHLYSNLGMLPLRGKLLNHVDDSQIMIHIPYGIKQLVITPTEIYVISFPMRGEVSSWVLLQNRIVSLREYAIPLVSSESVAR